MAIAKKKCSICESPNHSKFTCWQRPKPALKTRKPMNKVGRVGRETAKAVAKWKKTVKPNHDLTYDCYICGNPVPYLMAEHMDSKARHPERRTDPTNLKPVCGPCNEKKGSMNYTDIGGNLETNIDENAVHRSVE